MTIPTAEPKNILLGEGAFYFNYGEVGEQVIGASRGGGSFNREMEIREIEYDGALGPTKGMVRRVRAVSRLTLNSLHIQAENIVKFYAGLEITGSDPKVITAKPGGIDSNDYLTNVAFVGQTKDGRDVIIIIKNALGDGNIELAMENQNEVVPEVQFTGHYDPSTPTVEPWEIRWPADSPAASMVIDPNSLAGGYDAQYLVVTGTNTNFANGVTELSIANAAAGDVTGDSTVTVYNRTAAAIWLAAGLLSADSPFTVNLTTGSEAVSDVLTISL